MKDLWFDKLDTFSLCRGGGNGPDHPSQLYAIRKYVKAPGYSFLDVGSEVRGHDTVIVLERK